MQLIRVTIEDFRRFRPKATMNVDPPVVCIVGPNAAGKSSFLNALVRLNDDEPFRPHERTRLLDGTASPRITARFVIDDDDRDALSEVPEAAALRQVLLHKVDDDGVRWFEFVPPVKRDQEPREKASAAVDRLMGLRSYRLTVLNDEGEEVPAHEGLTDIAEAAAASLRSAEDALTDGERRTLVELASHLDGIDLGKSVEALPEQLRELVRHEERDPDQETRDILAGRRPQFLKFDQSARNLQSPYDVTEGGDTAIRNLLALGGTTFERATQIAAEQDSGNKKAWLDNLNSRLRERFQESWHAGELLVQVDLDGSLLSVLTQMRDTNYLQIEQESDGLRQFVALRAFVSTFDTRIKPVILIDEAETHLHYNAQADLVRVLEEQDEAAKVIYSTHSAGCLPRDLGIGIVAVVPMMDTTFTPPRATDHSRIENKFWTTGDLGYSAVLIGMGASAFAFTATQRAVIAEGMSDGMLYPSLIREATGDGDIGYQVTPGFAEVHADRIEDLDLVASRVAFLADGDAGGTNGANELKDAGVLAEQIVFLGGEGSGLSVEDLVRIEVYVAAINRELATWHTGFEISAAELPATGRSKFIDEWCEDKISQDGKPLKLSKVAVAAQILDPTNRLDEDGKPRSLLNPAHALALREAHLQLTGILDKRSTALAAPTAAEATE